MNRFTQLLVLIFLLIVSLSTFSSSLMEKSLEQIRESENSLFASYTIVLSSKAASQKKAYTEGVVKKLKGYSKLSNPGYQKNRTTQDQ